ncbi:protein ANTAGONIST OF LIKE HETEROCHROMATIN PROTEIN 1-like [Amphibalanus amphitrite]|uniref:protein ANTAGONIST OF LIKE HETEROCHROMATIN PROTEIN 1-like n=1 Tax=Amphibalanus amphitrite TaxID=1232801 RepID=UPI001C908D27|nr:protein ANTAGONIST OF LIKE HETEROCHROMATIN PROTEIN 1-like [Amphibalanus amphitrite]
MSVNEFDEVLGKIEPVITKEITHLRKPISAAERLAATLRYLASGGTMKSVAESYRIGFATIRLIVPETCRAIWEELGPGLMGLPSPEQWRQHALDYEEEWQFPNCCGAVDGKHIMVDKPANSGSMNFNYKGFFSIVLMAVVDAKCRFRYISVGSHGQESDGGVWGGSDLGRLLEDQDNGGPPVLPGPEPLPGSAVTVPHVFVADEAFPLRQHMMRPFPGSRLTNDQRRVFNYRLSRARRTSENAFGILAQRWRVFRGPIGCDVEAVKLIVLATCVLHNFLREKDIETRRGGPAAYGYVTPEERRDIPGLRDLRDAGASHNHPQQAAQVREKYVEYFSGVGSVPWQLNSIRR